MLNSIKTNLSDFLNKAGAITEEGTTYFKGVIGQLNIFTSSEALVLDDQLCDETHYLLVPDREAEAGYSLYIKRVLPDGYSSDNDLTKRRIFQLPNQESLAQLEELLHQELSQEKLDSIETSSPIADRLDSIAEEIDSKSNKITNGLLIIGGVVAVANPLLGVGIAAKALLPSLGSSLTSGGLDHVSSFFKKKKQASAVKEASKLADKEIKKLSPEIKINPLLAHLSKALYTEDPEHDPLTESLALLDNLKETRHILIASDAVSTIYAKHLKKNRSSYLYSNDINWLKSLRG